MFGEIVQDGINMTSKMSANGCVRDELRSLNMSEKVDVECHHFAVADCMSSKALIACSVEYVMLIEGRNQ